MYKNTTIIILLSLSCFFIFSLFTANLFQTSAQYLDPGNGGGTSTKKSISYQGTSSSSSYSSSKKTISYEGTSSTSKPIASDANKYPTRATNGVLPECSKSGAAPKCEPPKKGTEKPEIIKECINKATNQIEIDYCRKVTAQGSECVDAKLEDGSIVNLYCNDRENTLTTAVIGKPASNGNFTIDQQPGKFSYTVPCQYANGYPVNENGKLTAKKITGLIYRKKDVPLNEGDKTNIEEIKTEYKYTMNSKCSSDYSGAPLDYSKLENCTDPSLIDIGLNSTADKIVLANRRDVLVTAYRCKSTANLFLKVTQIDENGNPIGKTATTEFNKVGAGLILQGTYAIDPEVGCKPRTYEFELVGTTTKYNKLTKTIDFKCSNTGTSSAQVPLKAVHMVAVTGWNKACTAKDETFGPGSLQVTYNAGSATHYKVSATASDGSRSINFYNSDTFTVPIPNKTATEKSLKNSHSFGIPADHIGKNYSYSVSMVGYDANGNAMATSSLSMSKFPFDCNVGEGTYASCKEKCPSAKIDGALLKSILDKAKCIIVKEIDFSKDVECNAPPNREIGAWSDPAEEIEMIKRACILAAENCMLTGVSAPAMSTRREVLDYNSGITNSNPNGVNTEDDPTSGSTNYYNQSGAAVTEKWTDTSNTTGENIKPYVPETNISNSQQITNVGDSDITKYIIDKNGYVSFGPNTPKDETAYTNTVPDGYSKGPIGLTMPGFPVPDTHLMYGNTCGAKTEAEYKKCFEGRAVYFITMDGTMKGLEQAVYKQTYNSIEEGKLATATYMCNLVYNGIYAQPSFAPYRSSAVILCNTNYYQASSNVAKLKSYGIDYPVQFFEYVTKCGSSTNSSTNKNCGASYVIGGVAYIGIGENSATIIHEFGHLMFGFADLYVTQTVDGKLVRDINSTEVKCGSSCKTGIQGVTYDGTKCVNSIMRASGFLFCLAEDSVIKQILGKQSTFKTTNPGNDLYNYFKSTELIDFMQKANALDDSISDSAVARVSNVKEEEAKFDTALKTNGCPSNVDKETCGTIPNYAMGGDLGAEVSVTIKKLASQEIVGAQNLKLYDGKGNEITKIPEPFAKFSVKADSVGKDGVIHNYWMRPNDDSNVNDPCSYYQLGNSLQSMPDWRNKKLVRNDAWGRTNCTKKPLDFAEKGFVFGANATLKGHAIAESIVCHNNGIKSYLIEAGQSKPQSSCQNNTAILKLAATNLTNASALGIDLCDLNQDGQCEILDYLEFKLRNNDPNKCGSDLNSIMDFNQDALSCTSSDATVFVNTLKKQYNQ